MLTKEDVSPMLEGGSRETASTVFLRDGFVLLRNAVPIDVLQPVRTAIQAALTGLGSVEPRGSSLSEPAIWSGTEVPVLPRPSLETLDAVLWLSSEIQQGRVVAIAEVAKSILGSAARCCARVHVYCSFPDDERYCSPPHQDTYGLSGAPAVRLWIPLTEIAFTDASLVVAAGSHTLGRLTASPNDQYRTRRMSTDGYPEASAPVALEWNDAHDWRTASFRPGDVVALHPDLVHAAMSHTSKSVRIAIAIDVTTGLLDAASELLWSRSAIEARVGLQEETT